MALQCSKLFHNKVSSEFLRQYSQSLYNFGKIQNVGETELSEEIYNIYTHTHIYIYKILLTSLFSYIYNIHIYTIYIYIYIYKKIRKYAYLFIIYYILYILRTYAHLFIYEYI